MSSSSETGGPYSRFDPRRLLSSLCEFTRKMRRPPEDASNSERSRESNLDDFIWEDHYDPSTPLDGGRDKQTPTCDLCSNEQRQQLSHSLKLTDNASLDKYYTSSLSPDNVETPLETRDSIECLLETLQTQHGGKVPRWARRAARIANQHGAEDEQRSSKDEEQGQKEQKRPLPPQHETTVEVDEASLDARVVRKMGTKVASLLLLFEPLAR